MSISGAPRRSGTPGVSGSYLDIDGVWIAPVTAQVMMALWRSAIRASGWVQV